MAAGSAGSLGRRDSGACAGPVPSDVRLQSHSEGSGGAASGAAAPGGARAAGPGHEVCA